VEAERPPSAAWWDPNPCMDRLVLIGTGPGCSGPGSRLPASRVRGSAHRAMPWATGRVAWETSHSQGLSSFRGNQHRCWDAHQGPALT